MKIIIYYAGRRGSFILFLAAMLLCCSCKQEQTFENQIFIRQLANNPVVSLAIDGDEGEALLTVGSSYVLAEDETISVTLADQAFLNTFNRDNHTEYQLVPSSSVSLSSPSVDIRKGTALATENINVSVRIWDGYVEGAQYVVPVRIKSAHTSLLSGSDVALLLITRTTVGFAAQDGEFPIPVSVFGPNAAGEAYNNFTFEGRFTLTRRFEVPGNWRSDIFNGCGHQFMVTADGKIDVRFPNSSFMTTTATATLNTWYHFAITYSNGVSSLYINGELVGQTPYPGQVLNSCSIASYTQGTGAIVSEFRIWNTVRTPRQIRTFACAVNPADANLLGYWKLNDGSGNQAIDSSGKEHHLTSSTNVNWVAGVRCPQ